MPFQHVEKSKETVNLGKGQLISAWSMILALEPQAAHFYHHVLVSWTAHTRFIKEPQVLKVWMSNIVWSPTHNPISNTFVSVLKVYKDIHKMDIYILPPQISKLSLSSALRTNYTRFHFNLVSRKFDNLTIAHNKRIPDSCMKSNCIFFFN